MKIDGLIVLCLIFFSVPPVLGQFQSGDDVVIRERFAHDLYVAGGTVTINAPVDGDLIVVGGTVIINDTISQDILITGGKITVNGFVGDDIRGAGGTIFLSSEIAGDVMMVGGKITIDDTAVINGNFITAGGDVTLNGEVRGLIKNASGTFTLNGKAGNEMEIRGGNIIINGRVEGNSLLAANAIELGPEAQFNKNVNYWNKEGTMDFGNAISNGQATFDSSLEVESGKWQYLGYASLLMVLWYLATALLMIWLIQYLFSATMKTAAKTINDTALKSLGIGFLFLVGVPVLIVLSLITLIGIPAGILILISYISVLIFATVIVAILISNWINNHYYQGTWGQGRIIFIAFGIFILLKVMSLVPLIGPLIMVLLVGMAMGGILQNVKWKPRQQLSVE